MQLWVEKYRPQTVSDLVLDPVLFARVNRLMKNLTNLIITGTPGSGKTSTIKCIAREILNNDIECVLELNASDERGIKVVQETIEMFCKKAVNQKIKIVILDEADHITSKAQHMISSLMERYQSVRFALTCNTSSDIIESIQSRCTIIRYTRIPDEQIVSRLQMICQKENVEYDECGLLSIARVSGGDMRKAINHLQLVYDSYGEVCDHFVYEVCDIPPPDQLRKIIDLCVNKEGKRAIDNMTRMIDDGFSGSDIVLGFIDVLESDESLSESIRMKMLGHVCECAFALSSVSEAKLQLHALIANLVL